MKAFLRILKVSKFDQVEVHQAQRPGLHTRVYFLLYRCFTLNLNVTLIFSMQRKCGGASIPDHPAEREESF